MWLNISSWFSLKKLANSKLESVRKFYLMIDVQMLVLSQVFFWQFFRCKHKTIRNPCLGHVCLALGWTLTGRWRFKFSGSCAFFHMELFHKYGLLTFSHGNIWRKILKFQNLRRKGLWKVIFHREFVRITCALSILDLCCLNKLLILIWLSCCVRWARFSKKLFVKKLKLVEPISWTLYPMFVVCYCEEISVSRTVEEVKDNFSFASSVENNFRKYFDKEANFRRVSTSVKYEFTSGQETECFRRPSAQYNLRKKKYNFRRQCPIKGQGWWSVGTSFFRFWGKTQSKNFIQQNVWSRVSRWYFARINKMWTISEYSLLFVK